ncbi:MAG: DMT family transporter [Clostridiales bacterium]|nr:DMT family transporter [Clostridiales bacterium]
MQRSSFKGIILLLMTALIWGVSFVAQSVGSDVIGPFTYNGVRTLMGGMLLTVFVLIRDISAGVSVKKIFNKKLIIRGIILGSIFTVASNVQQFAFSDSTAGKIAFITALYIFFVPIIGLFMKKKIHPLIWVCIFMAGIGLYLLSVKDGDFSRINTGDILALICGFCFAFHIIFIDRFASDSDGVKLSALQFLFAGSVTVILMFIFEKPALSGIENAMVPLLYSGIMSCGVAYTFQIIGQKYTSPVVASLLMCLESVFAVIAAAILIKEIPSLREGIGCAVMFIAIILSQIIEWKHKVPSDSSC